MRPRLKMASRIAGDSLCIAYCRRHRPITPYICGSLPRICWRLSMFHELTHTVHANATQGGVLVGAHHLDVLLTAPMILCGVSNSFPYLDGWWLWFLLEEITSMPQLEMLDMRTFDSLVGGLGNGVSPQLRWLKDKFAENLRSIICHCGLQFFGEVAKHSHQQYLEVNFLGHTMSIASRIKTNQVTIGFGERIGRRKLKSSLLFGWTNRWEIRLFWPYGVCLVYRNKEAPVFPYSLTFASNIDVDMGSYAGDNPGSMGPWVHDAKDLYPSD